MLCSTSSYDYFDPWLWAQFLCGHAKRLKPFIAINPIYMHPFSAARMVASLSNLYGRKLWLNFITGSAKTDLEQLNDTLDKPARYKRLAEYYRIVMELLQSRQPVYVEGDFYKINGSTLAAPMPPELMPGVTWSGESETAVTLAAELNLPNLQMLTSGTPSELNCRNKSLAFGIVTRPSSEEAWQAAHVLYPPDRYGQKLLKVSLERNETAWKARIATELQKSKNTDSDPAASRVNPLYWLGPFENKYADCPYLVGSYRQVAGFLSQVVAFQPHSFVLTIKSRDEFAHIQKAFEQVALPEEHGS